MLKKRKRSNKSKYKHKTTGDHCTCAAYIAEIMCLRNAQNKNKGSLPYKFWNKKPWNWTFKRQLLAATKLLKEYPEEVLVKAVDSPEFSRIFSLNNPKALPIIKKYNVEHQNSQKKQKQELDVREEATTRKKSFGSKSKLNKLRSIKRGEKESE